MIDAGGWKRFFDMLAHLNTLHPMFFILLHTAYIVFLGFFVWRGVKQGALSHLALAVCFCSILAFEYEVGRELLRWLAGQQAVSPSRLLYLRVLYFINGVTFGEVVRYYARAFTLVPD